MNNKLTLSDLISLLAEYSGKSKADMELFLREFLNIVSEGLQADKIVRIKGFGTFKIILVDKRESVDVNTGERFVIPEHYKYSYIPDKELKDVVNKPFSLFETTEIIDNASFSDAMETDKNIGLVEEDLEEEDAFEVIEIVNEQPEDTIYIEEVKQSLVEKQETIEEDSIFIQSAIIDTPIENNNIETEIPIDQPRQEKVGSDLLGKEKSKSFYKREVLFSILILLGFAIIAYAISFAYKQTPVLISTKAESGIIALEDSVIPISEQFPTTSNAIENEIDISSTDTLYKEEAQENTEKEVVNKQVPTVIDKVRIGSGNRLTLISLKYYGHKIFWVYIYEANKNIIKDPNNIPIGTVVNIPSPELYGINANDRVSLSKAAALQSKILSED